MGKDSSHGLHTRFKKSVGEPTDVATAVSVFFVLVSCSLSLDDTVFCLSFHSLIKHSIFCSFYPSFSCLSFPSPWLRLAVCFFSSPCMPHLHRYAFHQQPSLSSLALCYYFCRRLRLLDKCAPRGRTRAIRGRDMSLLLCVSFIRVLSSDGYFSHGLCLLF